MIYYDFVLSSLYTCSTVRPPITATSLQWPLIFVPPESPKIGSCLNLSTTAMATKVCPLNCQNNLPTTASFFQRLMKKSRMVIKFDPFCVLMINHGNHTRIVFHFHCCSKHKLSTICTDLARFVTLTFWLKTLFKFFYLFISIHYLCRGFNKNWSSQQIWIE